MSVTAQLSEVLNTTEDADSEQETFQMTQKLRFFKMFKRFRFRFQRESGSRDLVAVADG